MPRLTVSSLIAQLAAFDPDAEVWVANPAAADGYSPADGAVAAEDPEPEAGDPSEFVAITIGS